MNIEFHSSEGSSLGVEVELEIVDRETRQLRSAASEILPAMGEGHPGGEHPKAKHELLESTIEIITGICTTVGEARADLEATLDELVEHTAPRGIALMCSGSHPFSDWADQQMSPNVIHGFVDRCLRGMVEVEDIPIPRTPAERRQFRVALGKAVEMPDGVRVGNWKDRYRELQLLENPALAEVLK